MVWARQEAELVMFNAVADLLAKTGLKPRQIDVLGGWQGSLAGVGCTSPSLQASGFAARVDLHAGCLIDV